jgi:tetratricopeptide (TPR) repeat protein
MNSERWQKIQLLFEEALAQPGEARSAYLESACGGEAELRDEVASLVAAHEQSGSVAELPTAWLGVLAAPDDPMFAAGERIAGRYLIRRLLGRGGMGEVYEAWDEELSIPVALKTLHLAGGSEETHKRLKLEGLLARSVWHPNVCRLYDLGRHGEGKGATWFLTMELLRGETLAKRLRDQGRLSLDRALRFAEQMAAGLGAAHRAGVVHRDFKPGNVMLVSKDGGEQAIVADFGIARAVSPGAASGEPKPGSGPVIGTPAYMAPEQARGEEAGPAADIYALGIVLYEMVTGKLPFLGGSGTEMARRRLREGAPSPRSVVPELDERWEAVILRCLAREPSRRFVRAEEVAEALCGRAPVEAVEAVAPAPRARHALPAERDPFVGREGEIEELGRHLAGSSRLATLLGAGGMGKTRLAVHYGWRSLGEWQGGVWFCDLTEARDLNEVASSMAGSLGVQLGQADPLAQLGRAIAGRGRCLVILDNFEQLVGLAADTVGRWVEQAAQARFLVTSRVRLNLPGERVQALESLPIATGMELFATRARGLRPGLELDGSEAESAREIVRLVDGMPLAIELAAARMRVMSAAQIVAQMRKRFQLLTGGPDARHETLEVMIDGSWELLNPWEKAACAQSSVFEGGFTLDAAESVIDVTAWPEAPWVVSVLQSLVDKSLLRTWVPAASPAAWMPDVRFGMYVSLQEYAGMRLREERAVGDGGSGVSAERAAEERHGKWFARCGTQESIAALDGPGGVERRRRLERDLPNLMAACRRALGRGDAATAVALYRAAWALLGPRGPYGVAVELGLEALRDPGLGPGERADLLTTLAGAEHYAGHLEDAVSHLESALAICGETDHRHTECMVHANLARIFQLQGRIPEGLRHAEATLAISREIGARSIEGEAWASLSVLYRHEGRMEESRAGLEEALAIYRELGNRRLEGVTLNNLGILHYDRGSLDQARVCLEAALAVHREVGNRNSEGVAIGNLGNLHQDLGQLEEARSDYEAALAIHREVGHRRFEAITLGELGNLCRSMGRMDAAREHLDKALAVCREVGARTSEGVALGDLGVLHGELGDLEEARTCFEAALAIHREAANRRFEGIELGRLAGLFRRQGRTVEAWDALAAAEPILRQVDRLELAKLLCLRGQLESDAENSAGARAALGEAEAHAIQSGLGPESELGRMLAQLRQRLGVKS